MEKEEWVKNLLRRWQSDTTPQKVLRAEAIDKAQFENALRLMVEMKILAEEKETDKKGRRKTFYSFAESSTPEKRAGLLVQMGSFVALTEEVPISVSEPTTAS